MQTITTISGMQPLAESMRKKGLTIGFVPTMGYLHEGHLSLMRRARKDCDIVAVSIFVNPTQFGPSEDFDRYPRDEEGDRRKCESVGVDVLFLPDASEMYPAQPSVFVTVEGISDVLEGAIRPDHFRGVATVVTKLLNIVKPHRAYFGQKDFQQTAVIKCMARGLNMDVDIVVLPTVREREGLAMSSRNSYLNAEERSAAAVVYRALLSAQQMVRSGERESEKLKSNVLAVLREARGIVVDYVVIADKDSLEPLAVMDGNGVILVAVRFGRTRLIDNLVL